MGNPSTRDTLPPRELAHRAIEYMGGAEAILKRAHFDFYSGDYRWVVHILDQVICAERDNMQARELCAAAHIKMGYVAENPTWRNAYLLAANELRDGMP